MRASWAARRGSSTGPRPPRHSTHPMLRRAPPRRVDRWCVPRRASSSTGAVLFAVGTQSHPGVMGFFPAPQSPFRPQAIGRLVEDGFSALGRCFWRLELLVCRLDPHRAREPDPAAHRRSSNRVRGGDHPLDNLIAFLTTTITTPYVAAVTAVLYVDLCARREPIDGESFAQMVVLPACAVGPSAATPG